MRTLNSYRKDKTISKLPLCTALFASLLLAVGCATTNFGTLTPTQAAVAFSSGASQDLLAYITSAYAPEGKEIPPNLLRKMRLLDTSMFVLEEYLFWGSLSQDEVLWLIPRVPELGSRLAIREALSRRRRLLKWAMDESSRRK